MKVMTTVFFDVFCIAIVAAFLATEIRGQGAYTANLNREYANIGGRSM